MNETRTETQHGRYRRALESIRLTHKGYSFRQIIAFDLALIVYGHPRSILKTIAQLVVTRAYRGLDAAALRLQPLLITIGSYGGRKDYQEILEFVKPNVGAPHHYDIGQSGWSPRVNPGNVIKALRLALRVPGLSLSERISLWGVAAYRLNGIDVLEGTDLSSYRAYLAFSSVHSDEAMFVEYFRQRGIPTYSLHHSAYGIYRMEAKPIDSLAYENLNADYHLCWGEYTKDEFIDYGIAPDRLLVAGYPRQVRPLQPLSGTAPHAPSLVFLCARLKFDSHNLRILQLLSEYAQAAQSDVRVAIKAHPSLDQEKYRKLSERYGFAFIEGQTIAQLLQDDRYHSVVTYNSTAYYDAYLNNRIALRYIDGDNELHQAVLDDGFSTASELGDKLAGFSSHAADPDTWETVRHRLAYIVGYGINRYAEFLDPAREKA